MLLDGKQAADHLLQHYRMQVSKLARPPTLAVILIGDSPASKAYIHMKQKACKNVGMASSLISFDPSISEDQLLKQIDMLNQDPQVDGILVQLPLPAHICPQKVMEKIDPTKDIDGFHPLNMGKLLIGETTGFVPCTPLGIQNLLLYYHIPISGKQIVIVGRSNIVGKPLAALLMQKHPHANATVTLAHSQSEHLHAIMQRADILVVALGKPHFVQPSMVKEAAVVIDVGITREKTGLVGDVDFQAVAPKCSAITPVPGGVGPMTVAMLIHNTLLACQRRCSSC